MTVLNRFQLLVFIAQAIQRVKLVSTLKPMIFFEFVPETIVLVIMVAAADVVVLFAG
jgi:hypothetical protein